MKRDASMTANNHPGDTAAESNASGSGNNNLLRVIALSSPSRNESQLRRLAEEVSDWESLIDLAQEHRVLPLLVSRLVLEDSPIPAAVQQRLQSEYQRNVFHSLANAAELLAVLLAFDDAAIPAMPFKGPVLAVSAYHDLALRPAGDLDILLYPRDLKRATDLLIERGYQLQTPVHADGTPVQQDYYEYHFERENDGMILELRWRLELTQPRFRRNLGMDWIWPQRRTAMLAGAEVPDMNPEIALLMLCMHGCKHIWSRLIWVCDVAELIHSSPNLDWNATLREARQQRLWRPLALGVLLAHRVSGAQVPRSVLQQFESDRHIKSLARHMDEHILDAPGSTPQSRIPYNLQLLSFYDRALFFLTLDFLRPTERDRATVSLPKALQPLYYLIRPFRIFLDRSAR